MDRAQLFDALSHLSPQDFERLLVAVNMPRMNRVGASATIGAQVSALWEWADSSIGPGLSEIQNYLDKMKSDSLPTAFDFSKYLQFLCQDPRCQDVRNLYTETEILIPLEAETVKQKSPTADTDREAEQTQQKVERLPVLEGLRKYALGEQRQHLLLAGRPGSGKSTTLKRLLLETAEAALEQPEVIPVYVQLKGDRPIIDLIIAEFRRAKVRVTSEQVNEWLFNDQLLLLLDGVNEIPSKERRDELNAFREDNSTTPMIFTTRDLAVGGELGIQKRLEMRPLSELQMQEFVNKYLTRRGFPYHADTLLRQLKDRLRENAETPLLLKMLCDVFDPATGAIPQNKGELFRLFDRDYERKKKNLEAIPVSENFWEFKAEVLQFLAFSMIQTDDLKSVEAWYALPRSRAEREIETWLNSRGVTDAPTKAKLWLKDLLRCHLLQDAKEIGEIEFHHQLFQEYYAAEYLLQLLPDLLKDEDKFKRDYLNLLKWTEAIALMLALVDDEAQALRVVKLAIYDVDLMLGASLAGKIKVLSQEKAVELVNTAHLSNGEKLPDWLRLEVLGKTRSPHAFERIIEETLKYPEKIGIAIESLYRVKDYSVEDWLLRNLESSSGEQTEIIASLLYILSDLNKTLLLAINILEASYPEVTYSAICLLNLLSNRLVDQFFTTFENVWLKYYNREEIFQILEILPKLLELQNPEIDKFRPLLGRIFDGSKNEKNKFLKNQKEHGLLLVESKISSLETKPGKREENINEDLYFNSNYEIQEAIISLPGKDFDARKKSALCLENQGSAEHLSSLWKAYTTSKEPWHLNAIFAIQNRYKFYNHEIWQEAEVVQNSKSKIQNIDREDASEKKTNNFPNATEVKIFERVEHYHEHPPDSNL